jgi:hypothetical protein
LSRYHFTWEQGIKSNTGSMKKNLKLYGVILCALSISSCSGGSKSSHVMDSSSMSVENANEVMKYYDTSLKFLKD